MDDEDAPSSKTHRTNRVPVAQGILAERHGISITDAVILLAAMADARAVPAMVLAAQIIDATVDPGSYPTPYGTSFVDPSDSASRTEP
jgi:AmiR/NasT family two-component response regulator